MAKKLTELRSLLSALTRKMGAKGATSKEIVVEFRKQYGKEITEVTPLLVDISLTKLISEVSNRKPRGIAPAQFEMFAEYGVPGMIVIRVSDRKGTRNVHKALAKTTISEVKQYLEDHAKPRVVTTEQRRELRRLLKDVEIFKKSDDSTIEECWRTAQEEKKVS